jgi:hypothetical protein
VRAPGLAISASGSFTTEFIITWFGQAMLWVIIRTTSIRRSLKTSEREELE